MGCVDLVFPGDLVALVFRVMWLVSGFVCGFYNVDSGQLGLLFAMVGLVLWWVDCLLGF